MRPSPHASIARRTDTSRGAPTLTVSRVDPSADRRYVLTLSCRTPPGSLPPLSRASSRTPAAGSSRRATHSDADNGWFFTRQEVRADSLPFEVDEPRARFAVCRSGRTLHEIAAPFSLRSVVPLHVDPSRQAAERAARWFAVPPATIDELRRSPRIQGIGRSGAVWIYEADSAGTFRLVDHCPAHWHYRVLQHVVTWWRSVRHQQAHNAID
jgi:hypothetical protein